MTLGSAERDILSRYIDDGIRNTILAYNEQFLEKHQWTEIQMQRFFELSADLLAIAGVDGYFKEVNQAWQDLLGWTKEELLARRYFDFVHPEDLSLTFIEASKLSQEGAGSRNFTNRYRKKDGSYVWLSWNTKSVGGLIYCIARDVQLEKTLEYERRLSLMRLELSQQKHQFLSEATRLVGSSLDPGTIMSGLAEISVPRLADYCVFVSVTPEGKFEKAAWRHIDPLKHAYFSTNLDRVLPLLTQQKTPIGKAYDSGVTVFEPQSTRGRKKPRRKRNSESQIEAQISAQLDLQMVAKSLIAAPATIAGKSLGVLVFAFSESDRMHTEEDVELAEELASRAAIALRHAELYRSSQSALQELTKERDLRERFVVSLTHDLRTPLTSIHSALEFIERSSAKPELVSKIARQMSGTTSRMDQLIQNILDMSRIRAGEELPLKIREGRIGEIFRAVVKDLEAVYGDRFVVQDMPAIEGYWDEFALYRLLANLCTNAIKYGDAKEKVTLSAGFHNSEIWFSVHNLGPPISEEDQKVLFDPFKRFKAGSYPDAKGWGIGLSLVRAIAEAHGGNVSVESSVEKGTRFLVTLPRDARAAFENKNKRKVA